MTAIDRIGIGCKIKKKNAVKQSWNEVIKKKKERMSKRKRIGRILQNKRERERERESRGLLDVQIKICQNME